MHFEDLTTTLINHAAEKNTSTYDVARVASRVQAAFDKLPLVEQEILRRRYAINGGRRETLEEISDETGLLPHRAFLVEGRALNRLVREVFPAGA